MAGRAINRLCYLLVNIPKCRGRTFLLQRQRQSDDNTGKRPLIMNGEQVLPKVNIGFVPRHSLEIIAREQDE